jgi:hypothetical protein
MIGRLASSSILVEVLYFLAQVTTAHDSNIVQVFQVIHLSLNTDILAAAQFVRLNGNSNLEHYAYNLCMLTAAYRELGTRISTHIKHK